MRIDPIAATTSKGTAISHTGGRAGVHTAKAVMATSAAESVDPTAGGEAEVSVVDMVAAGTRIARSPVVADIRGTGSNANRRTCRLRLRRPHPSPSTGFMCRRCRRWRRTFLSLTKHIRTRHTLHLRPRHRPPVQIVHRFRCHKLTSVFRWTRRGITCSDNLSITSAPRTWPKISSFVKGYVEFLVLGYE